MIMHHQLFTPVRFQAGEQAAATIPLAPRPSAATLLPEALSSGPSFPCLDIAPSIPHEMSMLDSEGDQGDGSNNHRGRSCGRDCSRKQRVRSLTPPTIIRLRPRFTHYYPSNNDSSSAVVGNAIVGQSSSFDPSKKSRGTKNQDLVGDMQLMRRSSLLDGQVNRSSSFPRAA